MCNGHALDREPPSSVYSILPALPRSPGVSTSVSSNTPHHDVVGSKRRVPDEEWNATRGGDETITKKPAPNCNTAAPTRPILAQRSPNRPVTPLNQKTVQHEVRDLRSTLAIMSPGSGAVHTAALPPTLDVVYGKLCSLDGYNVALSKDGSRIDVTAVVDVSTSFDKHSIDSTERLLTLSITANNSTSNSGVVVRTKRGEQRSPRMEDVCVLSSTRPELGVYDLYPRRLNSDGIENHFSWMRAGSSANPTAEQFYYRYGTALVLQGVRAQKNSTYAQARSSNSVFGTASVHYHRNSTDIDKHSRDHHSHYRLLCKF